MSVAWTAPRTRRTVAAVIAIALGAAAAVRVAAIEPSLRIRPSLAAHNDRFDVWNVLVESHGGEPIDEVAIEPVSGPVTFSGGTSIRNLPASWRITFEVHVDGGNPSRVRVVQRGRATREYLVDIGGAR